VNIYPLVVARLRRDEALIDEALRVLDHWDRQGLGQARRRGQWREILSAAKVSREGFDSLIALLEDTGERARRLKDFAPFAGVLSREERRKAFSACSYDH
jgi:hypothetical protein